MTTLLTLALMSCGPEVPETKYLDYPDLTKDTDWLDLGEVSFGGTSTRIFTIQNVGAISMGVSSVEIGPGVEGEFSLDLDAAAAQCPEGAETSEEDEIDDGDQQILFALGPGCRVPVAVRYAPTRVGAVYGSVIVTTRTQERDDSVDPAYYADLVTSEEVVLLYGEGLDAAGDLQVPTRSVDFGHRWPGESTTELIELHNAGEGDLLLLDAALSAENCDEGFSLASHYDEVLTPQLDDATQKTIGHVLPAGQRTLLEVAFDPLDENEAHCTLAISSEDADIPSVSVSLQGNVGDDPQNVAPSVAIISPEMSHVHATSASIPMRIKVSDPNQPADTLVCKVSSAVLLEPTKIADCTPTDTTGYVDVLVDIEFFEPGVDTFLVTVTDAEELSAYDSLAVMIQSSPSESDDDGDGFGDGADDAVDCDDDSIHTSPGAAELNDGRDNDCDLLIDEGTEGYDDDGDRFSEADGDCRDDDVDVYPGAPEGADSRDNDCDGTVDEGTALFDDDGDGYAEANNDCDDDDPNLNPGAAELCDGVDQNCNGIEDDGCLEVDGTPYIYGGIIRGQTAVEEGETISLEVNAHDPDGGALSFMWSLQEGHGEIDDLRAQMVRWQAPELANDSPGQIFEVYVVVTDDDGEDDWVFTEIAVYPEGELYKQHRER